MEIISKFLPRIRSLASKHRNTVCSHDDLVQEGILSILESLGRFDEKKGEIEPFLYTCLTNKIKHMAFSNSFALNIPSGNICNRMDDYNKYRSVVMKQNEEPGQLDPTIVSLEWRDFIESMDRENMASMYFFDGLDLKEIAKITKLSPSSISKHINKVRQAVKEEMQS